MDMKTSTNIDKPYISVFTANGCPYDKVPRPYRTRAFILHSLSTRFWTGAHVLVRITPENAELTVALAPGRLGVADVA